MPRVFVTGLPATYAGPMEWQLGNLAIAITVFKLLRAYVPDVEITTNWQFTEAFHRAFEFESTADPSTFTWNRAETLRSLRALARTTVWRAVRDLTGRDLQFLTGGPLLEAYRRADLVLDLNGDVFSEYLPLSRFVKHSADMLSAANLGRPLVEFASSPGPFFSPFKRQVARYVLNRFTVIANREPASSALLRHMGVTTPVVTACCPVFTLQPAPAERARALFAAEKIDPDARPLVGMTICAANMRDIRAVGDDEVARYAPMLRWLLDEAGAHVVMIPHVYRMNRQSGELIDGPDYAVTRAVYEAVNGDTYGERLQIVRGHYSPSDVKGLFGQLDLFVSGRMHAGIGALSQGIPTVMLAYGHKHYGIARVLEIEPYVYGGKDPKGILDVVKRAFEGRAALAATLSRTSLRAKELALVNFEIVRDLLANPPAPGARPDPARVHHWQTLGRTVEEVDIDRFLTEIQDPH